MEADEVRVIANQIAREQAQRLVPEITQRLLTMHMQKWNRAYETRLNSIEGWQTQFANLVNSLIDEVKVLNKLQWKCEQIKGSLVSLGLRSEQSPFATDDTEPATRPTDQDDDVIQGQSVRSSTGGMVQSGTTSGQKRAASSGGRTE